MPTRQAHIDQAEHNYAFWSQIELDTTQFLDWVVVGMFYEAAHWIEAYLAQHNRHSSNHHERGVSLASFPDLVNSPGLGTDYGVLRTESEAARYWGQKYTSEQIQSDLIPLADNVRRAIQPLLGI